MAAARAALFCLLLAVGALESSAASAQANPVRKVVQMLQAMQKKISEEGEKEADLFEKFMCYCKTGSGDLSKSIGDAETKIPQLSSDLSSSEASLAETKEGLKQDQSDRSSAKAAMAEATGIREKENAAFVAAKDEYVANIDAILKAVTALEKGMAGSFLQTQSANVLKKILGSPATRDMLEEDRQQLLSFLAGGSPFSQGYAPQSGQIVGLLKQLGDDMATSLAGIMTAEEKAVYVYGELMKAKTAEVNSLTEAIEDKTKKIGDLGVAIVQIKDDIDDTSGALVEDKAFLKELEKGCDTKAAEWEARKKTRAAELLALADTIKILNDDDALELFKKTLPAPGVGLVQMKVSQTNQRRQALAAVQAARRSDHQGHAKLDLIMLSLSGRKVSFAKVITMIDEMVAMLKEEQLDDEHKKEYCELQFDGSDDKKKSLEFTMEKTETAIEKTTSGIAQAIEAITALTEAIKALDESVATATSQRKAENEEYKALIASDSAAKELLEIAKNRLNQFYNPSLYNPPAKTELSAESRIVVKLGNPDDIVTTTQPGGIANTGVTVFAQVSAHRQAGNVAPPPPPATWDAYAKKGEESTGVIAMIDLLIKDLDTEMTEAETDEKESQKDYESMMAESAKKRAEDSKSLADKEKLKADLEMDLSELKRTKMATFKELQATMKYIASLHAECDWLMQFFEVRKEARNGEIKSLTDAKAVLSGADYSLLERDFRRASLRGA
jgi:septal ring factor EnvC (AmiA/AmiB activator)